MMKGSAFLLAVVALAMSCGTVRPQSSGLTRPNRTEVCVAASEQEIASLFDRWNSSLQTGDPHKVVANYATKSVLLPTVSNKPRLTPEEKEDYFHHFLENKPFGRIDSRTIEIDCNTAIDVGLYTFTFRKNWRQS